MEPRIMRELNKSGTVSWHLMTKSLFGISSKKKLRKPQAVGFASLVWQSDLLKITKNTSCAAVVLPCSMPVPSSSWPRSVPLIFTLFWSTRQAAKDTHHLATWNLRPLFWRVDRHHFTGWNLFISGTPPEVYHIWFCHYNINLCIRMYIYIPFLQGSLQGSVVQLFRHGQMRINPKLKGTVPVWEFPWANQS